MIFSVTFFIFILNVMIEWICVIIKYEEVIVCDRCIWDLRPLL